MRLLTFYALIYCQGSAFNDGDLIRAGVYGAKAVFVLNDACSSSSPAQDAELADKVRPHT